MPRWVPRVAIAGLCIALALTVSRETRAASTGLCDRPTRLTPSQHSVALRFAAVIKQTLEASQTPVAIVSRSGLNLVRFGHRYSHAGFALRDSVETRWSVRQLYFACEERRPRVFDEGLSGFVLGVNDPEHAFISMILLPQDVAERLASGAGDDRQALSMLAVAYSANAYPFDTRYQNCNQWAIEMVALALASANDPLRSADRLGAQTWLSDHHYEASVFDLGAGPVMWLSQLIPWIHTEDHPDTDWKQGIYRVSMPASIEQFVARTVNGTRRVEFCHDGQRAVIRQGGAPMGSRCVPGVGDTTIRLTDQLHGDPGSKMLDF